MFQFSETILHGQKYVPEKKQVRAERIENNLVVSFYVGCEKAWKKTKQNQNKGRSLLRIKKQKETYSRNNSSV